MSRFRVIAVAVLAPLGCTTDVAVADDATFGPQGTAADESGGRGGTSTSAETSGTTGGSQGDDDADVSTGNPVKLDVGSDSDGEPPTVPPDFPETCAEAERSRTSVGCTFYPYIPLSSPTPWYDTGLAVTNVAATPATVTLSDVGGELETAVIEPGDFYVFVVGPEYQTELETAIEPKGLMLESDEVVQVFTYAPLETGIDSDAGLVLPASALGTDHRVAAFNGGISGIALHPAQYLAVVAPEDDTEVTLTLANPTGIAFEGLNLPGLNGAAGQDTATYTLDRLDVLFVGAPNFNQTTGNWDNELTGTRVQSNKPVAVYSGSESASIPGDYELPWEQVCCADRMSEAVPPTAVWGKRYAGVKFAPLGEEWDVWRFLAHEDDTTISVAGLSEGPLEFTLSAGEFRDLDTADDFWAEGDRAFALLHFMTSAALVYGPLEEGEEGEGGDGGGYPSGDVPPVDISDCGGGLTFPGDPAMSWSYPEGNWLNRYLVPMGPGNQYAQWCHEHANVVAPLGAWDSITFSGEPLPEATALGDSGFGFARVLAPQAVHELVAPEHVGVEVTVYGYFSSGSYSYPGGVGLQTINPAG